MPISKAEQSYIKNAILSTPPQRGDGRKLPEFRSIAIQTGGDVAPLANGSARVNLGGTEVIAAVRLEVETVESLGTLGSDEPVGRDGGRVVCSVTWFVLQILDGDWPESACVNITMNLVSLDQRGLQFPVCLSPQDLTSTRRYFF